MNPCVDHCYVLYHREYSPECETFCDYAKEIKCRKMTEQALRLSFTKRQARKVKRIIQKHIKKYGWSKESQEILDAVQEIIDGNG